MMANENSRIAISNDPVFNNTKYTSKIHLIIPLSNQHLTIQWLSVSDLDDLLSFNISSIDIKDIAKIQVSLNETQPRFLWSSVFFFHGDKPQFPQISPTMKIHRQPLYDMRISKKFWKIHVI